MAANKRIDYDRIEPDWRAGIKSPEQLAAEYEKATGDKVSRVAITKHFKKAGIARDLGAKIRAKADAKVSAAMVAAKVSPETKITEQITVEVEAEVQSRIRLAHRADITRMRALVLRLLTECEYEAADPSVFLQLGEILRSKDDGPDRLNEAYLKAISLPQRIKGVKELAESMRILVAMEREAYGIDQQQPAGTFEQLLSEISEATRA
jgi:hypothetical protein